MLIRPRFITALRATSAGLLLLTVCALQAQVMKEIGRAHV